MVGWHHRLNGHELEQTLGVGEGPGSLACCSPWGCKKSDTTEQLSLTPLGLAGLISLLSKGLSRVFSSAKIQKHQFLGAHSL